MRDIDTHYVCFSKLQRISKMQGGNINTKIFVYVRVKTLGAEYS